MSYGRLNEPGTPAGDGVPPTKAALWRFSEWLSEHASHPELPIYIDGPGRAWSRLQPGIWLSAEHPFLAVGGPPPGGVRAAR